MAMNSPRSPIPTLVLLAGAAWVVACGDGATEPPPPDPPRATAVAVTPATAEFAALGETVQFTASVRDQNGREMAGAVVTWTTGNAAVATVDASGLVRAAGNGTATITATAGAASGSASVTVVQAVRSVVVSPAVDTLWAAGDTLRLTAAAYDANEHVVAEAEFSWASSDTAIATVDASGLVTGIGSGEVEISASSSGVAGRASLTVLDPVPMDITVTPDTVALTALGQTAQLAAEVRDQLGRVMERVPVAWSSADTAVAAIDSAGLVTATGSGTATITATAGAASGSASVTVVQAVRSVVVSPAVDTLWAAGDTLRLTAAAYDANEHVVAEAEFSWASSDTAIATVNASGLVTGMGSGEVEVTASSSGVAGRASLTVLDPVPMDITVTPDTVALTALGQTAQLAAEVRDQLGRVMEGVPVAWSSADTAVAAIDSAGLVRAAGNGTATITATAGAASGSASVTVAQAVRSVVVSPAVDTLLAAGDTLRLTAAAYDANEHVVAEAEFSWASSDTAIATVDASGLVTGMGSGEVEISASSSGVAGRASLTVLDPLPMAITVTPDTVALTALGQTAQLAAEVRDQLGRVMEGVPVDWSSADTAVAAVDSAGLVTATGSGSATVTASAGETSAGALVTVMQSVDSVFVSPPVDTIAPGDTLRMAAEAFDANGNAVSGARFEWSSSDGHVAKVDGSGLVRGVAEGTVTITAVSGIVHGRSRIAVENPDSSVDPDRAALVALYHATDGPNWVNSENWLSDAPLGDWHGVSTDASGRVVRLDLAGRWDGEARTWIPHGLSGPIPTALAKLAKLHVLLLQGNELVGSIPAELGGLDDLRWLYLSSNRLAGRIPAELGNLGNLRGLGLDQNQLVGTIPAELGNLGNLERLYLSRNNLSGPIPKALGVLHELETLGLGSNQLSGAIPPELGRLANLKLLYLYNNNLSGPIPDEFGRLRSLERVYLHNNQLSGSIPRELGTLAHLTWLYVGSNRLSGPVPPELGGLTQLEGLELHRNELSGVLPTSFMAMTALRRLQFAGNGGLCAPGTGEFTEWVDGLEDYGGPFCNDPDREVLGSLFELAGGSGWTESEGWLEGQALGKWDGVRVDSLGRVTGLDLAGNGLAGRLPANLGSLVRMTELQVRDNAALSGRLPLGLAGLSLRTLHYSGTGLCAPADRSFRNWLTAIPSHEGTDVECAPLSDREILEAFYDRSGGPEWTNSDNWLTDRPLRDWHGVEVDGQGRITRINLTYNNISGTIAPELGGLSGLEFLQIGGFSSLTGPIPGDLGNLVNLRTLVFFDTQLEGAIPPELGNLANLERLTLTGNLQGTIPSELGRLHSLYVLFLAGNKLDGAIPAELGGLAKLQQMFLGKNDLTGPIPAALGSLSNLRSLALDQNGLTGPLPSELGGIAGLRELHAGHNRLDGPVPPEFEGLTSLRKLSLTGNREMSGALPAGLTGLHSLETLVADDTGLCAPADDAFLDWLNRLPAARISVCGGIAATAYLVQTVQSREFPVPLVTGEEALLRTFVTASKDTRALMPPVRATFHLNGALVHVSEIPAGKDPIPNEVDEGSLAASPNAVIPARVIRPGLEMTIEIDPQGTLGPGLGVVRRIPETGRIAVDVREMPVLDLTVIPFLWSTDPDSAILGQTAGMATDPDGHELLAETRALLPVGAIEVTAHEPVWTSTNYVFELLAETEAIRVLEGGDGHYMGMMSGLVTGSGGVAYRPGRSNFSQPHAGTVAHELGHNMNLAHAPCGGAGGPDPAFPYRDGSSGVWGYDWEGRRLVRPNVPDLMGYCGWRGISDYHFTKALRFRLADEGQSASAAAQARSLAEARSLAQAQSLAQARSLLLWGGVDGEGAPFLEPSFVVDAPPVLPDSAGPYRLTGRSATGGTLFSLDFSMPELADTDGESSFAFALPVQPGWAALASVTLTGPGGSATLDARSDRPMAILRNPRNGQVRGVLRDPSLPNRIAADAAAAVAGPGLEVLFSSGVPDAAAWSRR